MLESQSLLERSGAAGGGKLGLRMIRSGFGGLLEEVVVGGGCSVGFGFVRVLGRRRWSDGIDEWEQRKVERKEDDDIALAAYIHLLYLPLSKI